MTPDLCNRTGATSIVTRLEEYHRGRRVFCYLTEPTNTARHRPIYSVRSNIKVVFEDDLYHLEVVE